MLKINTYSERSTVRNAYGQIRETGEQTVRHWRPEGQIVRDLMNCEENVLIGGGTDDVGSEEEGPGEDGRIAEEVGACYLQCDDTGDDVFSQWLGAAELRDLGDTCFSFREINASGVVGPNAPRGEP